MESANREMKVSLHVKMKCRSQREVVQEIGERSDFP